MIATVEELRDYYDRLNQHDWYYDFSDDGRVWRAGEQSMTALSAEAKTDPAKQKLFDGFREHMFSGKSFGTEKTVLPPRP